MISGPMPAGSPMVTAIMLVTQSLLDKMQHLKQRLFFPKPLLWSLPAGAGHNPEICRKGRILRRAL